MIWKNKYRVRRKIVAFSVAFVLLITGMNSPFHLAMNLFALGTSGSQDQDGSLGQSDSLGLSLTLGVSETILVSTADQLLKISERVNGGESFTAKTVQLTDDIALQDVEEWIPIGTAEHPFTGTFNGNEKTIGGMDSENPLFSKLLGYMKDAVVKDLTLAVRAPNNLMDVSAYLYTDMQTSTIENCHVVLEEFAPFLIFGRAAYGVDTSWYSGPNHYTLTTNAQLAGLAKVVNEDMTLCNGFDGYTITLGAGVDLGGQNWTPIGTDAHPFKGSFDGKGYVIDNLQIDNISLASAGLFGHVQGATAVISEVFLTNAQIHGANNVGILAGHVTDAAMNSCYSTGTITASGNAGGLVGYLAKTGPQSVLMDWCYSTANITGTLSLGGLVGYMDGNAQLTNCFATGNVSGATVVGGLVGQVDNSDGNFVSISHSASSGAVRGAGRIGGIAGSGVAGSPGAQPTVEYSYTSSGVYAFSDSGSIMGSNAVTRYTYTSGAIYTLGDPTDGFVNSGVGSIFGYSDESLENFDSIIDPTTGVSPRPSTRISHGFATPPYFFNTSNPAAEVFNDVDGGVQFTLSSSLEYDGNVGVDRRPIGGYYPQLVAFNSPGSNNNAIDSAFEMFSEISTHVATSDLPTQMEYLLVGSDGYLADSRNNSTPYDISSSSVNWSLGDGRTSIKLDDPTLKDGNTITLSGGQLKIEHSPMKEYTIVLEGRVNNVEGLSIKKSITIKDTAVRANESKLHKALHTESGPDSDFPDSERLTRMENVLYFDFPESLMVAGTTPPPGRLIVYDNAWGGTSTTQTVTLELLTSTLLKASWNPGDFGYDKKVELVIANNTAANHLADDNGNWVELTYYFISAINERPVIYFNPHVANAIETSPTEDSQGIKMVRNDPSYNPTQGYLEGVLVDNRESVIVLTANDATLSNVQNTLYGTAFPAEPGDTALTKDNFHKYPGIYEITYQVDDPEEPGIGKDSIPVVRTYEVTAEIQDLFMVDGVFGETHIDKYQPTITIDSATVIELLKKNALSDVNASIINEVESQLALRHKATMIDGSGNTAQLAIAYELSAVTGNLYQDGFSGVAFYGIGGAAKITPIYVNIEPALNMVQVETKTDRYMVVVDESFNQEDALKHFSPRLTLNGNTLRDVPVQWRLEGSIDTSNLYEYQVMTIVGYNIHGINGLSKEKEVVVVVVPKDISPNKWPDPKKFENDPLFWERVEVNIRQADPGKVVKVDLKRQHALAPKSIFTALAEKENVTLKLIMDNGLLLSIHSNDVDVKAITSPSKSFNVYIQNIQNLDVNRDARTDVVQQFLVDGYYNVPAKYTLSIPLDEKMQEKTKMDIYTFDMETGQYTYIMQVDDKAIEDGVLTLEMKTMDGEYVIH